MNRLDPEVLSKAIVVWSGRGRSNYPIRDDEAVVETYGTEVGIDLVQRIHDLDREFLASDAKSTIGDLKAMGDKAANDFRTLHSEISAEAVDALRWIYVFTYK